MSWRVLPCAWCHVADALRQGWSRCHEEPAIDDPHQDDVTVAATAQRTVVAGHFVSLDGVAEAPERFLTSWDDETDAKGEQLIATQDAVVLGRRTFDEWAGFWPTSDIEPFASFINAVPKYVATSTPLDQEWSGSSVVGGGLVDFVRQLKGLPGGDIGVNASISVTRALLAAGLVDEIRLVVAPVVVGSGRRLLDGSSPVQLEMVHSATSSSGFLLLDHRVVR